MNYDSFPPPPDPSSLVGFRCVKRLCVDVKLVEPYAEKKGDFYLVELAQHHIPVPDYLRHGPAVGESDKDYCLLLFDTSLAYLDADRWTHRLTDDGHLYVFEWWRAADRCKPRTVRMLP